MITSPTALQLLVDSNPQDGAIITDDQTFWLDEALYWAEVEVHFGLERGTLEGIYHQEEPMTLDVLEILLQLNGSVPVIEEEEDIWL